MRSLPGLRRSPSAVLSGFALALVCAAPAPAQPAGRTYGTFDRTVATVGAYDFQPSSNSVTWDTEAGTLDRYLTSTGLLVAHVHLPSGALVSGIEVQGCDFSDGGFLDAALLSNSVSSGLTESAIFHGSVISSVPGNPGCDLAVTRGEMAKFLANALGLRWPS